MKIRTKLSGKTLAILVVAIVSLSFVATGAIVNYLSNEVSETVTVESPFEIKWCNHYDWDNCEVGSQGWDGISDDDAWVAGGSGTFWAEITNKAPSDIDGSMEVTIKTKSGGSYLQMTGEEVTQFDVTIKNSDTCSSPGSGAWTGTVDVHLAHTGWISTEDSGTTLVYTLPLNTVPAGTSYVAQVDFGLAEDAHPGNYEISAQIV